MNKASTSADRHKAAQGLTLQIHLTAGNWSGIVLADAPSRNARVLSTPRSLLRDFVSLEELLGSGVYVLTGPDPESSFGIRSYIGESDHVGERIRSHARGKSFWSRAYVAVAKDRWLSKSHVRFLESRLMQEAARAPLISSVTNDRSEREYDRLPEGDVANLEGYIDLLRIMLPAIGCPLFSFPHLDFRPGGQAAQVFPLTVTTMGLPSSCAKARSSPQVTSRMAASGCARVRQPGSRNSLPCAMDTARLDGNSFNAG